MPIAIFERQVQRFEHSRSFIPIRELIVTGLTIGLWLTLSSASHAQSEFRPAPPQAPAAFFDKPELRIQTRQHSSRIFSLGVDKNQRFLVTGSTDKTVRVWSLPEMDLLGVLRVPIGVSEVGQIHSLAISPDGKFVAVGGAYRGSEGDELIYIFERESARIVDSLSVQFPTRELVFSYDGSLLGAALGSREQGDRGGVAFWRTDDWTLRQEYADYDGESYGLSFSRSGRAFTSSTDGYIREYDEEGDLSNRAETRTGTQPLRIAVSPDGDLVAVSYHDTTAIDVYDTAELSYRYSPDTRVDGELKSESFFAVSWAADGQYLFAGGLYAEDRTKEQSLPQIRRWDAGSADEFVDSFGLQHPILDLVPLQGGGLAFAGFGPMFGILDNEGDVVSYQGPERLDFRYSIEGIDVSEDGRIVALQPKTLETTKNLRFDISRRLLTTGTVPDQSLQAARTSTEGFEITDWRNSFYPRFNERLIELEPDEESLSLAISLDGEVFALGSQWTLRLFNRDGEPLWSVPVPEFAAQVNISGDNRFVVSAFEDGTIRWYDAEDGDELISLYIEPDDQNWVLWTPSGYYDASVGGEALLGWHLNQAFDEEALFYSAARFRETYYRPDLVANVLEGTEAPDAPDSTVISDNLPPVVKILDVNAGDSGFLNVRFEVHSPSVDPVSDIHFMLGGRRYSLENLGLDTGDVRLGVAQDVQIPFFQGDDQVQIVATTVIASSDPDTRGIRPTTGEAAARPKPNLYALVIGISNYEHLDATLGNLKYADDDARDVAAALMLQQNNDIYASVVVRPLENNSATRDEVLEGLDWLSNATEENDVAILYVAGHGLNDFARGQERSEVPAGHYYFLPYGAQLDKLASTGVPAGEFMRFLNDAEGVRLVFFDTCQAGNVDNYGLVNLFKDGTGAIVYASSAGNTPSYEGSEWGGHGAFTAAFLSGIKGMADNPRVLDGYVDQTEMALWLSTEVATLTKDMNPIQVPVWSSPALMPTKFLETAP